MLLLRLFFLCCFQYILFISTHLSTIIFSLVNFLLLCIVSLEKQLHTSPMKENSKWFLYLLCLRGGEENSPALRCGLCTMTCPHSMVWRAGDRGTLQWRNLTNYPSQGIKVNTSSHKHADIMSPSKEGMKWHFTPVVFLPVTHHPTLRMRNTAETLQLSAILQNTWPDSSKLSRS